MLTIPQRSCLYTRLSYAPDGSLEKCETQEQDGRATGAGLNWPDFCCDVIAVEENDCRGRFDGGYDDIAEGASVTVYGASGDVIATGELGDSTERSYICFFDVAIEDMPKGEKFYKVEVSHRGTVQLSAEEAENGELEASLG